MSISVWSSCWSVMQDWVKTTLVAIRVLRQQPIDMHLHFGADGQIKGCSQWMDHPCRLLWVYAVKTPVH